MRLSIQTAQTDAIACYEYLSLSTRAHFRMYIFCFCAVEHFDVEQDAFELGVVDLKLRSQSLLQLLKKSIGKKLLHDSSNVNI
jgi:hypothetical protein